MLISGNSLYCLTFRYGGTAGSRGIGRECMYQVSFVRTEWELKQVLDFCYGISGQHLRGISPYRYED